MKAHAKADLTGTKIAPNGKILRIYVCDLIFLLVNVSKNRRRTDSISALPLKFSWVVGGQEPNRTFANVCLVLIYTVDKLNTNHSEISLYVENIVKLKQILLFI